MCPAHNDEAPISSGERRQLPVMHTIAQNLDMSITGLTARMGTKNQYRFLIVSAKIPISSWTSDTAFGIM